MTPHIYGEPWPIDPANNVFGNKYPGENKYAFLVFPEAGPTYHSISIISNYVDAASSMTPAEYELALKKTLGEFGPNEDESLGSFSSFVRWAFRYMYEGDDVYTEDQKLSAKEIILAIEEGYPASGLLPGAVAAIRSAAHTRAEDIKTWLQSATKWVDKQAELALMNKQIGQMTGYEFKRYLTLIGADSSLQVTPLLDTPVRG